MMKVKGVLISAAGIIGAGLTIQKIKNQQDKFYIKRESELTELERQWFNNGYEAGYNNGKRDAELDAIVKSNK